MTDDLYERYKEALRVGHVAVLRGELEQALRAYRTAASIAPSRALPHTSLGGVLLRLGHLEDALVEYAAAVARAPHDEGALLGQAEALTIAGQRNDAAQTLDHVAEIQEASGRLPEAADTLRRALELDDAPERARHQRGLLREIRLSAGDQAAEQMLARALRLRDAPTSGGNEPVAAPVTGRDGSWGTAVSEHSQVRQTAAPQPFHASDAYPSAASIESAGAQWPKRDTALTEASAPRPSGPLAAEMANVGFHAESSDTDRPIDATQTLAEEAAQLAPDSPAEIGESVESSAGPLFGGAEPGPEGTGKGTESARVIVEEDGPVAEAAAESPTPDEAPVSSEPVPVGVMEGAFDTGVLLGTVGESQHQPTGDELLAAAEAADLAGDNTTLRSLLLWTARAYAREGRFEAGLDATHRLLQRAPGDVDAHLVLVELYVARDWNGLAAEKLVLLGRLADLDNDVETKQRLCAVATRAFPGDERMAALYG